MLCGKEAGIPLALDDATEVAADTLLDCSTTKAAEGECRRAVAAGVLTAQSDAVPDALPDRRHHQGVGRGS